jgi:hypothetical protein
MEISGVQIIRIDVHPWLIVRGKCEVSTRSSKLDQTFIDMSSTPRFRVQGLSDLFPGEGLSLLVDLHSVALDADLSCVALLPSASFLALIVATSKVVRQFEGVHRTADIKNARKRPKTC